MVVVIKDGDLKMEMFDDRGTLKVAVEIGEYQAFTNMSGEKLEKLKKLVNSL